MRGRSLVVALALLGALAAGSASADEPKEDAGVKLGRLRLLPSFGLSYTLDSNLFLRDDGDVRGPQAAHRLNIAPALALTTISGAPVEFSVGAGANYNLYLSSDSNIRNLSDAAVTADLNATFNPKGDITFAILESFRRTTAAPTIELPTPFNRNTNRVGARLGINPGGRALTFDVYYFFTVDLYENFGFGSTTATSLNSQAHEFSLRSRWKFLPKTAFIAEVTGTLWRWDEQALRNANLLRIYAGLIGNLTAKLTVTARLGYGNSFHSSGDSFSSILGDVEVAYAFTPRVNAKLSYARDFSPSAYGNYYDLQRVGVAGDVRLWDRLSLSLGVNYFRLAFAENPDPTILAGAGATLLSPDARRDNQLGIELGVKVKVWRRFVSFQAGYSFTVLSSNNGLVLPTQTGGTIIDRYDYLRHVLTLGLHGQY